MWREYHFLVPPTMAAKYLKMFLKKDNKEILYNPAIESEYREWLSNQIYSKEQTNCQNEIVVINKNDKISNIEEKYTLLCNNNVNLVDGFYSEVSKYIEEDYDLIYFDNDEEENNKYKNPVFKPDWSRDTLLGVNYIGNCYLIKTELLKQYDKLNLYKILLDQIGKDIKIKHIPKILYHDLGKIENGKKK